jgi:hypothetical protein
MSLVAENGGNAGQRLDLGSVAIGRPRQPGTVEPEVALSDTTLIPDLALLGYGLDPGPFVPGDRLRLRLYWQVRADIQEEYGLRFQLLTEEGNSLAEWLRQPAYPTSHWQAGDVWRDSYELQMGAGLPAGEHQLVVQLMGPDPIGSARVDLGPVEIQERAVSFEAPAIEHPMLARMADKIRFLGYDLGENEIGPGETLHLTLYWQAVSEMDLSYTVFTHVLDEKARIFGQQDSLPAAGSLPTTLWLPGEIVVDRYEIPLQADAPPGAYSIEIGLYQATSGQRLIVLDEGMRPLGDHLVLDQPLTVQ